MAVRCPLSDAPIRVRGGWIARASCGDARATMLLGQRLSALHLPLANGTFVARTDNGERSNTCVSA